MPARAILRVSACVLSVALSACTAPPPEGDAFDAGVRELRTHYYGTSPVALEPVVRRVRTERSARCRQSPGACGPEADYEALASVTAALRDQHTNTYNPGQYQRIRNALDAEETALPSYGLFVLSTGHRTALVQDIVIDSPAEEAGLQPGDRLTNLNEGEFLPEDTNLTLPEVFDDPPVLTVRVERGRVGVAQTWTVTLEPRTLRRLKLPVLYTPPDAPPGVQVLRIPSFMEQRKVGPRVHALVRQARRNGTRSLIVDLRGGRGGSAAECVTATGAFIGPYQVVNRTRRGGYSMEWTGRRTHVESDPVLSPSRWSLSRWPYVLALPARWEGRSVVLVDAATASCHEFMAHEMQRAGVPVLGEPTYGILSTVTVFRELPGGGAVQFSAYRFHDSSGQPGPERVTPNQILLNDPLNFAATGEDAVLHAAYARLTHDP